MTIKELEEFKVICEKGSLAKASKELFMSPQGLSRVLKNLETELDCTLVNRVTSGLELTESGQCLKKYADNILNEYNKLRENIENIRGNEDGAVDLVMACDIIRYLTPDILAGFQKANPNILFSLQEYPDRIAERMLAENKGNIALSIGPFANEWFHVRSLKKYRLFMLVNDKHPLAGRDTVTVDDLKNEKLYLENSSFKINEFIHRRCWNKGFEPNIVFETNGFDMCYKMCRMKKGISVTTELIHSDMKTEGTVMIPFEEEDMVWEIGILTLKNKKIEPAVEKFIQCIERVLNETLC